MFGHDSLPSVVYEYGGKGPVEGMELIDNQMRKAHEYRNRLVERELKRREEIEAALMRFSTELAALEREIAEEEKKREEMRQVLRSARAFVRSRIGGEDLGVLIEDSTKRLKRMYHERKRLRNQAFRSDKWKKIQEAIEERDREERKKLRAKSGLYWGTYLHVEQSCSGFRRGAPPRFHRWDGSGHLAVQIVYGMSVEKAFSGNDNRLRIEPVPPEAWQPGGRHLRKTFVWFRVGSDEKGLTMPAERLGFSDRVCAPKVPELLRLQCLRRGLISPTPRGRYVGW